MLYITGDTHADFSRLSSKHFKPACGDRFTRDDMLLICGDFGGVWRDDRDERYWLDWLDDRPYQVAFVDGTHENFDLLSAFPVVDFCGGKAHEIRPNIHHLLRGEVFDLCGHLTFAFGGASSHDIDDGILDPADPDFDRKYHLFRKCRRMFRVKGRSWWPEEMPNETEMAHGKEALAAVGNGVDLVVTHCLPQEIAATFSMGLYNPDPLTMYLNGLLHDGLRFNRWYCGHYHIDGTVMGRFHILYEAIVPVPDYEINEISEGWR